VELRDYLKILRKRGWIIVLLAVLTALSAYGWSKTRTPVYRASVKMNVIPARPDWGLSQSAKDLLRNFARNIDTYKTAQKVIDRGQLDITPAQFVEMVEVNAESSDFTIQIAAKSHSPQEAEAIVRYAAEVFEEVQRERNNTLDKRDRVEVSMMDTVIPVELFSPKPKMNALAGGILGTLLGVLIVFLLEWLEADIVRTPEDVERHLGLVVLGAIPVHSGEEVVRERVGWRQWLPLPSLRRSRREMA